MHHSSGVPALLQYLIAIGIGGLVGHVHRSWTRVPKASTLQSLGDPPRRSLHDAFRQARHDELVRLAHVHEPTTVPGLVRPDVEDLPILSLPVHLYESRPVRWFFRDRRVSYGARPSARQKTSGNKFALSPVDHGTLELTRRRFVFSSSRRRREFALDQLTHFTATKSGIALAAHGDSAISYFKGIPATDINFEVIPGSTDPWPHVSCTFDFTGYDVKEIARLVLFASDHAPA